MPKESTTKMTAKQRAAKKKYNALVKKKVAQIAKLNTSIVTGLFKDRKKQQKHTCK
jgi:hypothetical protein